MSLDDIDTVVGIGCLIVIITVTIYFTKIAICGI